MVIEGGVLRSENADMSNDKPGEIPGRRKPEVSWAMLVIHSKSTVVSSKKYSLLLKITTVNNFQKLTKTAC